MNCFLVWPCLCNVIRLVKYENRLSVSIGAILFLFFLFLNVDKVNNSYSSRVFAMLRTHITYGLGINVYKKSTCRLDLVNDYQRNSLCGRKLGADKRLLQWAQIIFQLKSDQTIHQLLPWMPTSRNLDDYSVFELQSFNFPNNKINRKIIQNFFSNNLKINGWTLNEILCEYFAHFVNIYSANCSTCNINLTLPRPLDTFLN